MALVNGQDVLAVLTTGYGRSKHMQWSVWSGIGQSKYTAFSSITTQK